MLRIVLSFTAILFVLTGCGQAPDPSSRVTGNSAPLKLVQHSDRPDVTSERVVSDIVGKKVRISELTGDGPEDEWTFNADEFRQVDILEEHTTGTELTLVILMTTRSNPKPDEDQVQVSGKLRLQYERNAGRWILRTIENLTFRYSVGVSI